MNYLVAIAEGIVVPNVKSSRVNNLELAATNAGIRLAAEAFDNYHDYIDNQVAGFQWALTQAGQNAGVYAHVLGNAGLHLYGGVTGNVRAPETTCSIK